MDRSCFNKEEAKKEGKQKKINDKNKKAKNEKDEKMGDDENRKLEFNN